MRFTVQGSLVLMAALAVQQAGALPRFAARTGAKCQSCHVNPSGGGMRQTYGVEYGREVLPVPTWSSELGLEDYSTQITDFIGIGADMRTLFYYQQQPDSIGDANAFWQMQGDLYVNLRLARRVSVYFDKGLYSGFEVYGLLGILPANGFIKVGKFLPGYGMKLDDHRAFIRDVTGFSPERGRPELTGGEVGISPGAVTLLGGAYNASDAFGAGGGNAKAFLGRVDGIFRIGDDLAVGAGANVFHREADTGPRVTLWGGMGMVSYGDLTLLGEADLVKTTTGGSTTSGLVTYAEAGYFVTPGVDLKAMYEFHDPDIDMKTGSRSRISLGLEFFPISGVEVRPLYRINTEDPDGTDNDELHVLLHLYF